MNIEECLPPALRGPGVVISKIAAGLSGAGVYRIESAGQVFVLKIAADSEDRADWQRALPVQRLAAAAGLAPRIVHVDEDKRAVLTEFVADQSFPKFYRNPATHEAAVALLGRTVRRLHALPIPADAPVRGPHAYLANLWTGVAPGFALPDFVRGAVTRVLEEESPNSGRAPVLSHNDLNPSNLVYDGEGILILDWASAGPVDPFYDLAVLALFLRMDEATCVRLLSAYDDAPVARVPEAFSRSRRLAAALAGTMSLHLARMMKHAGATGAETLADTLALGDFYQQMMAGVLRLGTPEGQWAFGLALLKESLAV
jgi:aminoglycoside phosphotransferase (APT) family kinase protein